MKRALATIALTCVLATSTAATNRAGRPMIIHRLPELGLEIWTEQDPEWETYFSRHHQVPTWIAETPALTYPPAQMSWTSSRQIRFTNDELESAARGAIDQVAANYGVRSPSQIIIKGQRHGELIGYEATFEATSRQIPIDVQIFVGHQPGKPVVAMHVATLRNKLGHLDQHIRRSWGNVRYLD